MNFLRTLLPSAPLPAYVLHRSPMVLVAFERDFLSRLTDFQRALPAAQPVAVLLQLGWYALAHGVRQDLNERLRQARALLPQATFFILANEEEELGVLDAPGILCNHNALLDPAAYPLCPSTTKRFDAIYVARITPFKRHELASEIQRLHLVGSYSQPERDYACKTLAALPQATWTPKVYSWKMSKVMSEAACGLALSETEGAMFSCGEYALSGIPVVTTPNHGGRSLLLPDFAQSTVPPDPIAIAEAVLHWKSHAIPPQDIRNAFLQLAQPHRQRLLELLRKLTGQPVRLPHKLGVRRHLSLTERLLHTLPHKPPED